MTTRRPTIREVLSGLSGPVVPPRLGVEPAHESEDRVITISRQPGARGEEIARALGRTLGFQVYDREIIHGIAETTRVTERAVAFLDETAHPPLTDWLRSIDTQASLSPHAYFEQLVQLVKGIAQLGAAVILGRGAHLILGPSEAVRVMVVAPLDQRVRTVAECDGVDLREAARRVAVAEAERSAFLSRYFHVDPADQSAFDLVLNTAVLGVEGAVEIVRAALVELGERKCAGAAI